MRALVHQSSDKQNKHANGAKTLAIRDPGARLLPRIAHVYASCVSQIRCLSVVTADVFEITMV